MVETMKAVRALGEQYKREREFVQRGRVEQ